ncbi:hypothetical protein [Geothrix oryzae]|uniref:hypothetical protein n=1 Tax=Geothrix oryzae TaxID=2927975 RepID=UPI00257236AD|nr:hypothetical protein [Geothrix oryzae]
MKPSAILLAISVLFAPALAAAPKRVAQVRKIGVNKYEIELRYSGQDYGGPCEPTMKPRKFVDSDWIYLSAIEGEFSAEQIILTYERGKTDFPQSGLKGSISIRGRAMDISLEVPNYRQDSSIDHYEKYHLNGPFKINLR